MLFALKKLCILKKNRARRKNLQINIVFDVENYARSEEIEKAVIAVKVLIVVLRELERTSQRNFSQYHANRLYACRNLSGSGGTQRQVSIELEDFLRFAIRRKTRLFSEEGNIQSRAR